MFVEWAGIKPYLDDDLLLVAAARTIRRNNARFGALRDWRRYNGTDAKTKAVEDALSAFGEEEEIRMILASASSLDDLLEKLSSAPVKHRGDLMHIGDVPVFAAEMPDWRYASDERMEYRRALVVDDGDPDERIISYDVNRLLVMGQKSPFLVRILS